jgi:uncharacterized protein
MAIFSLTCIDKAGALDLRMATRAAHLAYLDEFMANVKLAGPLLDEVDGAMIGSHFILDFETLAQAQAFAANDPYASAGLFDSATLRPYRVTIGGFAS